MHGRTAVELPAFQRRLDRQADALRPLRHQVWRDAGLHAASSILDVGCGTGAATAHLAALGPVDPERVVAIDVSTAMARRSAEHGTFDTATADGARLPFADASFDAAVCTLTLLWASEPQKVVAEMRRVVRPGGVVVATMEPDYGGKLHWPSNPLVDAVFQGDGVARRGGDPHAGRKLRDWFTQAGLTTRIGIANPQIPTPEEDIAAFRRNRGYYRRLLEEGGFEAAEIDAWEQEYLDALDAGIELCFLPLLHAIGQVPATAGAPLPKIRLGDDADGPAGIHDQDRGAFA